MRRAVTIQVRDTTPDAYGQLPNTWTDVGTAGAETRSLSLSEITSLNRESAVSMLQFDFHRSPTTIAISPQHRLVFGGVAYDIVSVDQGLNGLGSIRVIAELRT